MSKGKSTAWGVFKGTLLAAAVYLGAQLLLALAAVRSILPESELGAAQIVTCVLAVLIGCLWAVKSVPIGTLPAAVLVAGCFSLLLLLGGFLIYNTIAWAGQGGVLLAAALATGAAAGLVSARLPGRKRKRKRRSR